jgi:arabinose-5-phosphate isomerase
MSTLETKTRMEKEDDIKKQKKLEEISEIVNNEIDALNNIPISDSLINAIDLIYTQVHVFGSKCVLSGIGKAGQIANNIATTLSSTGTPAVFLHAAEAQHGDLGLIQKNDVLLLISNSGKTREVIEFIELAHNLYKQLPVIVLTSNKDSELAKLADVVLCTGNPEEVCPLGLTPTTSTTVMTVIGDIIITQLMKKIKFTKEEYLIRHHGGYNSVKIRNNI